MSPKVPPLRPLAELAGYALPDEDLEPGFRR
jgi:hypothetical protein